MLAAIVGGWREWVYDAKLPARRDATRAVELACGAYMAGASAALESYL